MLKAKISLINSIDSIDRFSDSVNSLKNELDNTISNKNDLFRIIKNDNPFLVKHAVINHIKLMALDIEKCLANDYAIQNFKIAKDKLSDIKFDLDNLVADLNMEQ